MNDRPYTSLSDRPYASSSGHYERATLAGPQENQGIYGQLDHLDLLIGRFENLLSELRTRTAGVRTDGGLISSPPSPPSKAVTPLQGLVEIKLELLQALVNQLAAITSEIII